MSKLENLIAQYGISSWLNFTQALVALIDSDGQLLDGNLAFAQIANTHPKPTRLPELLDPASKVAFAGLLAAAQAGKNQVATLSSADKFSFKCLLLQAAGEGYLFFAEPARKAEDDEITRLTAELKQTRRALKIKKIDLESVLVQANEISHTDALTFLANRRQIVADLQREVTTCERYHKPLTIFMTDIDHFKLVNDTHGHQVGDQALRNLANELQLAIRQIDKVGRYGGEEFLFLLPATSMKSAIKMADRLLERVRQSSLILDTGQTLRLTLSIGIAQYRTGKETWEELLRRADKALYKSKENGRDQWTISNFNDEVSLASRSPKLL